MPKLGTDFPALIFSQIGQIHEIVKAFLNDFDRHGLLRILWIISQWFNPPQMGLEKSSEE